MITLRVIASKNLRNYCTAREKDHAARDDQPKFPKHCVARDKLHAARDSQKKCHAGGVKDHAGRSATG
ncbi:hypothetical protein L195_g027840 [Trifolium pratense]|uniref:Uncharacterized protein n=1 Tax=Trifolium pratense TaxID=57577 RepID=A0A2K3L0A3_TRIPR|nr:hypothetical protein L195_g027840 [Trifolium pratense]